MPAISETKMLQKIEAISRVKQNLIKVGIFEVEVETSDDAFECSKLLSHLELRGNYSSGCGGPQETLRLIWGKLARMAKREGEWRWGREESLHLKNCIMKNNKLKQHIKECQSCVVKSGSTRY